MGRLPVLTCGLMGLSVVWGCQRPAAMTPRGSARPYPLDRRGFSPVDRKLAEARPVVDDAEGALNPYVLRVVEAYPLDGSYPYHADFKQPEYDVYNGVTQDLWYRGYVVAKAYPDGSRCSYCCGLTFEILVRAMRLRNLARGLDPDDFNGLTAHDLFNLLQIWYIEGEGDSPQRAIEAYGLGRAVKNFEEVKAGDFADYSCTPPGGHSVIFIDWVRDASGRIVGLQYFSSNRPSGIGYATALFSDCGGRVLRDSLRIARVGAIERYRSFDRTRIPRRQAYAMNQPGR